jgi:2-polyprenyl-6-methoxyphenol hydroxylase-like FAD-dependent oxidoreductase
MNDSKQLTTQCCLAGGGPAGVVLGFLLARAGVDTVVLEKHGDFLRDFRGDTVHPSTLEVMHELGLLDDFLRRPHQEYPRVNAKFGEQVVPVGDLSHLPTHCKFIALMPQWDFLNFLTEQGRRYPGFHVKMQHEVTDLLEDKGQIVGVKGRTPTGEFEVRAPLTIGSDGRNSIIRQGAGLQVEVLGAPIDVLWMRLPKHPSDADYTLGHFKPRKLMVTINRGDYWQCARVIAKGEFDQIRERGIAAFRKDIVDTVPFFQDRVQELRDWNDIKLLSVAVDRLRQWYRPGLLCIGDSAHAMSPVGGVGINLAVQDAVAAANILAEPLLRGQVTTSHLLAVQSRRLMPTRRTQAFQVQAHNRFLHPLLEGRLSLDKLPLPVRLLRDFPVLRRIPARVIGLGFRPEHVRTPAIAAPNQSPLKAEARA